MAFNVLFFSIFSESIPSFWPSYFFTTAAMALAAFIIGLSRENWFLRDSFLCLPLIYSSCAYCAVQFAFAFLAVSIPNLSPVATVIVQAALMTFYAISSASALLKKRRATDKEYTIEDLASEVELLASSVKNASARNKLMRLHRTISDIVEQQYENQTGQPELSGQNFQSRPPIGSLVLEKINELKSFTEDAQEFKDEIGVLCDEIATHFTERSPSMVIHLKKRARGKKNMRGRRS
jgi:hypothetical protein